MLDNSNSPTLLYEPKTTGRHLVLFEPRADAQEIVTNLFQSIGDLSVSSTRDIGVNARSQTLAQNAAKIYHRLNVAVVNAPLEQLQTISSEAVNGGNPILVIEAERVLYSQETSDSSPAVAESQATWGLAVTQALTSPFSGRGIRVAILDTGLDTNHPDFAGRQIVSQSFIDGETVEDGYGHGTHCTGTACGSRRPGELPRYGIANEAEIYIGKVLSNGTASRPAGTDNSIIAGINWAVENNCPIISMSLGTRVVVGTPYSQIYEILAKRLLDQGILIIAAAGNDSFRNFSTGPITNPVNHPANCPSIMAVGAVDSQLQIGSFSNRSFPPAGGEVNLVGPGVQVYSSWSASSWKAPKNYKIENGTSMATPHVAGIAALLAEANPGIRGKALWDLLLKTAKPLPHLDVADVGAGLVQAPVAAP